MGSEETSQILIAEDNRSQRTTIRDILHDRGYPTLPAGSGKEALDAVAKDAISLALIDLKLGDMSGLEVLKDIKNVKPDVECIVITAHASQESAIESLNLGAYGYLQKPLDTERLLITVGRALEKRAADRELRQLKRFHEGIVQNMAEGIAVEDEEGRFTFLNSAACDVLGYSKEELLGQHWTQVIPPDQEQIVREANESRQEGASGRYEVEVEHKDGSRRQVLVSGSPQFEDGEFVGTLAVFADVTDRVKAQHALQRQFKELKLVNALAVSGAEARSEDELISHAVKILGEQLYPDHVGILLLDEERGELAIHPSYHGLDVEGGLLTVPIGEGVAGKAIESGEAVLVPDVTQEPDYIEANPGMRTELCVPIKAGERVLGVINVEDEKENAFDRDDQRLLETFAGQLATAMERVRFLQTTQRRAKELTALYQSALLITQELDSERMLAHLCERVDDLFSHDAFLVAVLQPESGEINIALALEEGDRLPEVEGHRLSLDEKRGLMSWMMRHQRSLLIRDMQTETLPVEPHQSGRMPRSWLGVPMVVGEQLVGALSIQSFDPHAFDEDDQRLLELFASQAAVALENARLFSTTEKQVSQLALVNEVARKVILRTNPDELFEEAAQSIQKMFEYPDVMIFSVDHEKQHLERKAWVSVYDYEIDEHKYIPLDGRGIMGWVVSHGETAVMNDVNQDERYIEFISDTKSELCVPMLEGEKVIGGINVESNQINTFDETDVMALETLADSLVAGLRTARLFADLQDQVNRLKALRNIDRTISSSFDLNLPLNILLQEVMGQLNVSAADVLLYDPGMQTLEYAAGRGFQTRSVADIYLRLGESHAGQVALERKTIHLPDCSEAERGKERWLSFVDEEGFRAYVATPLIAKGELMGVLEVYHRSTLDPDPGWFDFLETLSMQAAIAIDHMRLFDELNRSNVELTRSYEMTLEGWAKALELRDQETQGHSDRVTTLTLKLAERLGVDESHLKHIRWGALMHDVGKMGIPDRILQKPGGLTDEEWKVMKKHPVYAYEMLSAIDHLEPALDIPRYHHERWDGSGYPQGLKGEEIPLAARIFAVADVWDALRSDRPYREAWMDERALEHIESESGKHFDPQVVEVFVEEISQSRRNDF